MLLHITCAPQSTLEFLWKLSWLCKSFILHFSETNITWLTPRYAASLSLDWNWAQHGEWTTGDLADCWDDFMAPFLLCQHVLGFPPVVLIYNNYILFEYNCQLILLGQTTLIFQMLLLLFVCFVLPQILYSNICDIAWILMSWNFIYQIIWSMTFNLCFCQYFRAEQMQANYLSAGTWVASVPILNETLGHIWNSYIRLII